jgi:cell wall-associated NlpC family hydrolase
MASPRRLLTIAASIASAAALVVAASAPAAPGDVAKVLRRQQLFLTAMQTKSVQRRIHVHADGDWGSGTVDAMRRYQRRHRLAVTGSANVESLRAMGLRVAARFEAQLWAARAAARRVAASTAAPASDLAASALRWSRTALGAPYRSGGQTPAGFDCSGLVSWAFDHAGLELPRTSFAMYRRGWAVARDALRPGDLVFFDAAGAGASHVGIVVTRTTAISATTSSGVAIHDIARGYWGTHYVGARRLAAD